jgi:hypothetical protein
MGMDMEGSSCGLISGYVPVSAGKKRRKATRKLNQESGSPNRDMKPTSSEYDGGSQL